MRVGVVTFPGTLDNRDVERALKLANLKAVSVWHKETELHHVDAVVLPGGKSYGDYLRPGALAKLTPVMQAVIEKADSGAPVLGIGNGFQILLEAGLLLGGITKNVDGRFKRVDATVKVIDNGTPWTKDFDHNETIILPVRNSYGVFSAQKDTLSEIQTAGLTVLEYDSSEIAGIKNHAGNVVGIMPHPEFAVEKGFGPDTSKRMRSGVDGLRFFTSLLN